VPDADLPPLLPADADLAVEAREMADWVWEYVDDTWELTVEATPAQSKVRSGTLFLIAPDGDAFRLHEFGFNFGGSVEHWDPALKIAWIHRSHRDDFDVVQIDLTTGEYALEWGPPGGALAADGALWRSSYVGAESNGREVWITYGYFSMGVTSVFFRNPDGSFAASASVAWLADKELAWSQSTVAAWIDLDRSVAIYRLREEGFEGKARGLDITWFEHNLVTDVLTPIFPQTPSHSYCTSLSPAGAPEQFDDGAPVMDCQDEDWNRLVYRIDITGVDPPEQIELPS